jgi:hypothetical protein
MGSIKYDVSALLLEGRMRRKSHLLVREHEDQARRMLKAKIWDRGLTYRKLAELLMAQGLPHAPDKIRRRVSRGFMLQCFAVMGVTALDIPRPQSLPCLPSTGLSHQ